MHETPPAQTRQQACRFGFRVCASFRVGGRLHRRAYPLVPPYLVAGNSFGQSGGNVAVGVPDEQVGGPGDQAFDDGGIVYPFDAGSGEVLMSFVSPDPVDGGNFGEAVATQGNVMEPNAAPGPARSLRRVAPARTIATPARSTKAMAAAYAPTPMLRLARPAKMAGLSPLSTNATAKAAAWGNAACRVAAAGAHFAPSRPKRTARQLLESLHRRMYPFLADIRRVLAVSSRDAFVVLAVTVGLAVAPYLAAQLEGIDRTAFLRALLVVAIVVFAGRKLHFVFNQLAPTEVIGQRPPIGWELHSQGLHRTLRPFFVS